MPKVAKRSAKILNRFYFKSLNDHATRGYLPVLKPYPTPRRDPVKAELKREKRTLRNIKQWEAQSQYQRCD